MVVVVGLVVGAGVDDDGEGFLMVRIWRNRGGGIGLVEVSVFLEE